MSNENQDKIKEEIVKLIEERRCKLLVKAIDSDKEFKVNVSKMEDVNPNYKVFTNVFLDYSNNLDEDILDFWTGQWYFDDLFSNMENTEWKWEITE